MWLPSLRAGLNYNKHEGAIQDVAGHVFNTSRGSVYTGLGASAVGAGSPATPGVYAQHAPDALVRDLVSQGLGQRPEVAECRHLVCEAVRRLQRERYAPLIPSVLLGISYDGLGGGLGGRIENYEDRLDADAAAYWELRNLGLGEQAARAQACSRLQQAQWREVAVLDRIAREVVETYAQVLARRQQLPIAEEGIRAAQDSYQRNLQRIRDGQGLPIEVLQAIQALAQARPEYLRVLTDYNTAQFSLHRAVGWPGDRRIE